MLSIIFIIIAFIILDAFSIIYEIRNDDGNTLIIILNVCFIVLSLILLFWIILIKIQKKFSSNLLLIYY